MKIRGLIEEDFVNYEKPSMFIITPYCDFKCCKEAGNEICQNLDVVKEPIIEIDEEALIRKYLGNPITKSIVFGGLEPFYGGTFDELYLFVSKLRIEYKCFDPVVIYTGYYKEEIENMIEKLSKFSRIIVKFGRFIPDQKEHYDPVLGVMLASDNQYAVVL